MIKPILSLWQIFDHAMRRRSLVLVVLMLVGGMLEACGIGLVIPLFHVVSAPDRVDDIAILAFLNDVLGRPDHTAFVTIFCIGLFLFFVAKNLFVGGIVYFRNRFVMRGQAVVASRLLDSYLSQPYAYHLNQNTAGLLRNLTQSVGQLFSGTALPILMIITELCVVVAVLAVLVATEPVAALTVSLVLGVPIALLTRALRRRMRAWGMEAHHLWERSITILHHALNGIKEIKVLGRAKSFQQSYYRTALAAAKVNEKQTFAQELPRISTELLAVGGLLAVAMVVMKSGRTSADVLPVLGLFGAAAFRLMPSANRISSQFNAMAFNAAAFVQVAGDLAARRDDGRNGAVAQTSSPLQRDLTLDDVSFRYNTASGSALRGIHLRIEKGQSVALVGPSGSGKSTLVNLLLGLLTPSGGRILIDGADVSDSLDSTRFRIGFVPQDAFLIDDTLAKNVAFGLDNDEIDDRQLARVLEKAQLTQFIAELPDGVDTLVGERGVRLSGGQRQRISIARALYTDPEILILDEATSALDAETESIITRAMELLRGDTTLITVAHRLSTVKNCDRIFWLKDGQVSDSGTFAELADRNPEFNTLVKHMDLSSSLAPVDRPHGGAKVEDAVG